MKLFTMKLRPLSMGLTGGILGAFYMLFITFYPTITGMVPFFKQHGQFVRYMMYDMYPLYGPDHWYTELAGLPLGFIDGFIFGILAAYLYNWLAGKLDK